MSFPATSSKYEEEVMATCSHCHAKIGLVNFKKVGDRYFCNSHHYIDWRKGQQQESRVSQFLHWLQRRAPSPTPSTASSIRGTIPGYSSDASRAGIMASPLFTRSGPDGRTVADFQ